MTQTAVAQFSNDQLAIVRETVAKKTTPAEFKLFIEVCKYHGLNPFARQIYAVVREGQQSGRTMSIQTSIDGYRLLAERSGKYAGQIGPQWCGEDEVWKDVWLKNTPPSAARIGVLRKDFAQPTWGIAKYDSYSQSTPLWKKMPDVMLAKCAESLALRKAFPAEMSGIYTKEEMDQADDDTPMPTFEHHNPAMTIDSEPQPQYEQSAPRQQQQSAKASPAPQDDETPATEQQITAIQRLSASLDREMPADMDKLTLFGAKKLISLLTADIRERKATQSNQNGTQTVASGQPEVQNAVPSQNDSQPSQTQSKPSEIDAVRSRWFKAYHIKDDDQIDIRWKAFKLSLFNGSIEDAALRQSHITRINDTVGAHERKQQRSY